jgi:hypothetical protein
MRGKKAYTEFFRARALARARARCSVFSVVFLCLCPKAFVLIAL